MRALPAVLLFALAVAGCGVGRDFVRPDPANVRLGKSTTAEIRMAYGAPRTERSWTRTESDLKSETMSPFGGAREAGIVSELYYYYSDRFSPSAAPGVNPSKSTTFWFVNDRLAGYLSSSSFAADPTLFDEAKVASIKPWKWLRADVVAALGKPSGALVYPLVSGEDLQVMSYYTFQFDRGAGQTRRRVFHVLVDSIGVVRDVHYESTTRPIPAAPATSTVPIYVPPPTRSRSR